MNPPDLNAALESLHAAAPPRDAVRAWLSAARDPQISGELELVYAAVARQVDRRRPVCTASGRCCRFEAWGHRLYTTGLEAACTLASIDPVLVPSRHAVADALVRGACPLQQGTLCGVHPHRPLGCRVYYCDPTAQDWQHELSERTIAEVRAIHDRHGVPYRYAEWRTLLAAVAPLIATDATTDGAG